MFLIMSAAYIGQELKTEFGAIPPSFLPLGNHRLFLHQVKSIPDGEEIYLSLPKSYEVPKIDQQLLKKNNVNVLSIPEGLSLGASFVFAVSLVGIKKNQSLSVLFGDTLITPLSINDDIVSVSSMIDDYERTIVTNESIRWLEEQDLCTENSPDSVVSGYFRFSKPNELAELITQNGFDFIQGISDYGEKVGLKEERIENWLDFGHVNTYYRSKALYTTQRAFNSLYITKSYVKKSSTNNQKIKAEANWFENLPCMMRQYTPQYLGKESYEGTDNYCLEYLYHSSLSELFVFSRLPPVTWESILHSCFCFVDDSLNYEAKPLADSIASHFDDLFCAKTFSRLEEFSKMTDIDLDKIWNFNDIFHVSLSDIISVSKKHLPTERNVTHTLLHGDFCFSNILYDFRSKKIKVIDPRGLNLNNEMTIYGDFRYDIAKLSHSILGLYDRIIAGYFFVKVENSKINFDLPDIEQYEIIQNRFIQEVKTRYELNEKHLYAMQIQLFLSMLPLHSDDEFRQKALFANVFRLYELIRREE